MAWLGGPECVSAGVELVVGTGASQAHISHFRQVRGDGHNLGFWLTANDADASGSVWLGEQNCELKGTEWLCEYVWRVSSVCLKSVVDQGCLLECALLSVLSSSLWTILASVKKLGEKRMSNVELQK